MTSVPKLISIFLIKKNLFVIAQNPTFYELLCCAVGNYFVQPPERGDWEPSPLYFIPPRCQVRERGERRVEPPQSPNICVFNVCRRSTNEVRRARSVKCF